MSIETPFPVKGTITAEDYGYSASLPCDTMWLTETEDGTDYLQAAVDRAAREYGEGVEVRVRFTSGPFGDGCAGYELLGPVEDDEPEVATDGGIQPVEREVYIVRDGDGEEVQWFLNSDAAVDLRARLMSDHEDGDDVTVHEEVAQVCQGCDDTRVPLEDGLCFYCYDADSDAVERFDEVFREVAEDFNFAVAFWSYDRVYNRYDGLGHSPDELPDDLDAGFDGGDA